MLEHREERLFNQTKVGIRCLCKEDSLILFQEHCGLIRRRVEIVSSRKGLESQSDDSLPDKKVAHLGLDIGTRRWMPRLGTTASDFPKNLCVSTWNNRV